MAVLTANQLRQTAVREAVQFGFPDEGAEVAVWESERVDGHGCARNCAKPDDRPTDSRNAGGASDQEVKYWVAAVTTDVVHYESFRSRGSWS